MLFDKWKQKKFDESIFKNPTSEFRGAPFWAWNSALVKDALCEQIDIFKEMGFGGFNMHVRQGLETKYLSKDFFDAVKACVEKAEENNMFAWLYDEDRWPSGAAGGFVTKTVKHRIKALMMTTDRRGNAVYDYHDAIESGAPVLVATFSLNINEDGILTSYRRVNENDECPNKRYFYCLTARGGELRYNFQSYVDALSHEAIDSFKEITYDAYKNELGDKFGKSIPAIFTDEPQTKMFGRLKSGHSKEKVECAWTWDIPETFKAAYGFDIVEFLPELFYKTESDSGLKVRYYFYRHLADRFANAFVDNLGEWCENNGISFTGHLMCEDDLEYASRYCYDSMRMYKNMQLPGIDVLFDKRLFTTAKQCESVVRQMGKEGLLSEMYGVTGWDFDFRGHKFQGDWQACLGVNVRVPHLSWQTMKGEGKRDYPASIHYQSPWYKEYRIIEDHYARVTTALSRGKAVSHVAVIHPIETYWMYRCSEGESNIVCDELNSQFKETCEWLLTGSVNFDYVAESLLPELCKNPGCPLVVGQMEYDTVILENCETLRPTTVSALTAFANAGGRIIISGLVPSRVLAEKSDEAKNLLALSDTVIPHTKSALLAAISKERDVTIGYKNGGLSSVHLYTRRTEGDFDWLFICNSNKPELNHIPTKRELAINVKGLYKATLYDTMTGNKEKLNFFAKNGETKIYIDLYDYDSALIRLDKIDFEAESVIPDVKKVKQEIKMPSIVSYNLSEKNSLLLDMPKWRVNAGALQDEEELMRIDEKVRIQLGLPLKRTKMVQPWAVADAPEKDELYLKFNFRSEIEYDGAELALENLIKSNIVFNGEIVSGEACGYFVDKEIHTCRLPKIKKGENILEITMPFGVRTDAENCFILGYFGTAYRGREAYITSLPEDIAYGDASRQGLAFYGANIEYMTELNLDEPSALEFEISYYRGALVEVSVDGKSQGYIWKSPFRLETDVLAAGNHNITYTVFGNRYNTFSALHTLLADKESVYIGPDYWRSAGFAWSYEYNTRPFGILKTPIINKIKKEQ